MAARAGGTTDSDSGGAGGDGGRSATLLSCTGGRACATALARTGEVGAAAEPTKQTRAAGHTPPVRLTSAVAWMLRDQPLHLVISLHHRGVAEMVPGFLYAWLSDEPAPAACVRNVAMA